MAVDMGRMVRQQAQMLARHRSNTRRTGDLAARVSGLGDDGLRARLGDLARRMPSLPAPDRQAPARGPVRPTAIRNRVKNTIGRVGNRARSGMR